MCGRGGGRQKEKVQRKIGLFPVPIITPLPFSAIVSLTALAWGVGQTLRNPEMGSEQQDACFKSVRESLLEPGGGLSQSPNLSHNLVPLKLATMGGMASKAPVS